MLSVPEYDIFIQYKKLLIIAKKKTKEVMSLPIFRIESCPITIHDFKVKLPLSHSF